MRMVILSESASEGPLFLPMRIVVLLALRGAEGPAPFPTGSESASEGSFF